MLWLNGLFNSEQEDTRTADASEEGDGPDEEASNEGDSSEPEENEDGTMQADAAPAQNACSNDWTKGLMTTFLGALFPAASAATPAPPLTPAAPPPPVIKNTPAYTRPPRTRGSAARPCYNIDAGILRPRRLSVRRQPASPHGHSQRRNNSGAPFHSNLLGRLHRRWHGPQRQTGDICRCYKSGNTRRGIPDFNKTSDRKQHPAKRRRLHLFRHQRCGLADGPVRCPDRRLRQTRD